MDKKASIIATFEDCEYSAHIEYTLELIFSTYGIEHAIVSFSQLETAICDVDNALVVSYGQQYLNTGATKHIHVYASGLFGKDYLKPTSMPKAPLQEYGGLPVIYRGHGAFEGFLRRFKGLIETNIDIIASSFFMLSRYEEVVLDTKDRHCRFPAEASLAWKDGFLDRPIVNEYIELLWSWIQILRPDLERKPLWPAGKKFAVCLTHDIDFLRKYSVMPPLRTVGSALLRQWRPRLAVDVALDHLQTVFHLKRDPADTFDYILDTELSYGFRSSFYFLGGGDSKFDGCYSVGSPRAMELIRRIEQEGNEVGLHGSYYSYGDEGMMAFEKSTLDDVVLEGSHGCRQHYLRWKTPETWRAQEKAGFLYDTTLTFASYPGFRCGLCLPFKPFDVIENRKLDIWELPTTVMDKSLQSPNYQGLGPGQAYPQIVQHIETVRRFGGVFVLLWHNTSFDPLEGWHGWNKVYEATMQYLSEQDSFVSCAKEIIDTWAGSRPPND